MKSVKLTVDFSILVQILLGLLTLTSIFFKLPEKHNILNEILLLETIVQFIELFFYVIFLRTMAEKNIKQMALFRYFDWFITTPTMLLTTIIYFKYEEYNENNINNKLTFNNFIQDNIYNILFIVICNFLMLLFGFLYEKKLIDKASGFIFGFIFFILSFYNIYINYAIKSTKGKYIFYILFIIWSLYGFAFLLKPVEKNNFFNILDIFSKNFFGLYLFYLAYKVKLS
jgi:hypothetical protein